MLFVENWAQMSLRIAPMIHLPKITSGSILVSFFPVFCLFFNIGII